ncbi:MAG: hypothetical protein ACO3GZ_07620, partial [Ilumatobacteraceae bacterium]
QYRMVSGADIGADGTTVHARPTTSAAPQWSGSIPAPSPALLHHEPVKVCVVDANDRPVSVSGRGFVSMAPDAIRRDDAGDATPEVAWAGPWPVEERWWVERARRAARFQLVVRTPDGQRAYLAEVSSGQWWLVAEYA